MQRIVINVFLLTGLFYSSSLLVSGISDCRMPGNEQGYSPVQPIDYSHRLHAGELGIDCRFCHTASRLKSCFERVVTVAPSPLRR